jgi:hypothetical protein
LESTTPSSNPIEPALDQSPISRPTRFYVRRPSRRNGRFGSRLVRVLTCISDIVVSD